MEKNVFLNIAMALALLLAVGTAGAETVPDSTARAARKERVKEKQEVCKERMRRNRRNAKELRGLMVERRNALVAARKELVAEQKEVLLQRAEAARMKADSILEERNRHVTMDTLYVARPPQTWTFRGKSDIFSNDFHIHTGEESGYKSDYYMYSDPKTTVGVMANYRGISLAVSLSPSKLLSDLSDMVSAVNYYSNTVGFDLTYEKVDYFRGKESLTAKSRKLPNTNLRSFSATGYYVFNGRRFSYPAVFNSTWVQKRSAGSFLLLANYNTGRLKIGDQLEYAEHYPSRLHRLDMNSLSLGVGYGYNLVAGKHWLFHLTAQPSVMVWKKYQLHTVGDDGTETVDKMPADHMNIFIVGRMGAIYSWDRYFLGMTSVVQHYKTGKESDIALRDTKWKVRAFFGWRM